MRRSTRKRPVDDEEETDGDVSSIVEPAKKRVANGLRVEKGDSRNGNVSLSEVNAEGWERDSSPGLAGNALTRSMFEDSEMISPLEDFDEDDDEPDTDSENEGQVPLSRVTAVEELKTASGGNKRPRRKNGKLVSSSDDSAVDEEVENRNRSRNKKRRQRSQSRKSMPRCASPVWSALTAKEQEKCGGLKSGTVKSLRLYNFMCHESFFQEWHPNINFVIGENGSGKSALLSGMLIGLGAKATATSRSRSTADLIMKGKDSARTQIVLMNKGHLSVTKYGREFMLERTISKTGASTYRIRPESNNWRPLKRNELDHILMVLNIQLDNPVAILNQEIAKNFLRTKDPKDKYELFYMGTLLKQLFGLLADSRADMDAASKNLEVHKKVMDGLRDTVKKLHGKLQEFEGLRKLSDTIKKLETEYLWALVQDEEKKQATLQEKLSANDASKVSFEANIADLKLKMQKTADDKTLEEVSALRKELDKQEKRKETIRHERNAKIIQQNQLKAQLKPLQSNISGKKGEISMVERTLSQVLAVSEEDEERFTRAYEAKKEELDDRKVQVLQTLNTLRNDGDQFKNGAEAVGEKLTNLENEHANLLRNIEMKKRLINSIDGPNRNKYAAYGPDMANLVRKLESNANKFKKPPRGPIGSYITIKNPKFTKLIEDVMMARDLPFSFVVDNPDDLRLLQRLVNETYGNNHRFRPTILSNMFSTTAHDIRNGEARVPGVPTLLDMIEVDDNDPVIINALLDYLGAERILLFETNTNAARVMKDRTVVPPTCTSGYTLEWFKFTPKPNYAARVMRKLPELNFLRSSKRDQKQTLQRDLEELKLQLETIRPELDSIKKEKSNLMKQWTERKNESEKKKRDLAQIEKEKLQNERNKYQAPDVASHREELQSLQEALAELEEKKVRISQQLEELSVEIQTLVEDTRLVETELPKIINKLNTIQSEKENSAKKIEQFRLVVVKIQGKMAALETQRAPIEAELNRCQAELDRKLEQANENTQRRVETSRTSQDVKKEFELIKRQKGEMEKHLGNQRKLQEEYEKFKEEFSEKCKEYDPLYKSFVTLRDLVEAQLLFLFKKRTEISNGLSLTYVALAQQRGYKGQMLIDHEKKELHFFICPDKSSSSKTASAVKDSQGKQSQKSLIEYSLGLSGGERSFSTICFILSLWQVMECPFYMLDEFDVYMDALNRKASQNALITHAKTYTSNQFFLYTPLELCEVPDKKDALTLRLRPARPTEENPQPPSPVTDNETENVNPNTMQPPAGRSKGKRSGRGRNTAAMSEKNPA